MLPGPKTIFRPVHEKSSSKSGKSSANFQPQILPANFSNFFFLRPLKSFMAEISATWQHCCCPATHPPHFPLPLPPLPLTPSVPSSPPTDCSISQILQDDYCLPFCEIIILWFAPRRWKRREITGFTPPYSNTSLSFFILIKGAARSRTQGCQMAVATAIFQKCNRRNFFWLWQISGREWPWSGHEGIKKAHMWP